MLRKQKEKPPSVSSIPEFDDLACLVSQNKKQLNENQHDSLTYSAVATTAVHAETTDSQADGKKHTLTTCRQLLPARLFGIAFILLMVLSLVALLVAFLVGYSSTATGSQDLQLSAEEYTRLHIKKINFDNKHVAKVMSTHQQHTHAITSTASKNHTILVTRKSKNNSATNSAFTQAQSHDIWDERDPWIAVPNEPIKLTQIKKFIDHKALMINVHFTHMVSTSSTFICNMARWTSPPPPKETNKNCEK
jgi:hypothetical protein